MIKLKWTEVSNLIHILKDLVNDMEKLSKAAVKFGFNEESVSFSKKGKYFEGLISIINEMIEKHEKDSDDVT